MVFKKIVPLFFILLASCVARDVSQKGFIFTKQETDELTIGITSKENTLKILGYPLNKSYFNDNIWIYYSYKMRQIMFFKPKLKEQKVLVVEFDPETDIIKNLALYDINTNKYEILNKSTKTDIDNTNILKDILNNIGQIGM